MTYPQQPGRPQQPEYGYPQQPTPPYGQQPYPAPQGYPPQPPPKKYRGKIIGFSVIGVIAAIVVISVIGAAVGGDGSDESSSPPDSANSAPAAPKEDNDGGAAKEKEKKEKKPAPKQPDEADDLTSIELDDRSEYGITDIWVTYTVKNNSSKASDYLIKYEVIDSSGTRVYNDELYVTSVKPGQTANEEMFTTLESMKGMKLNVTGLDRTEAL